MKLFPTVFIIEDEGDSVIIQIDGVDEAVYQAATVVDLPGIQNLDIVLCGESLAFTKLTINTFFPLIIGRISCIDYTIHSFSPLLQSLLDISAPETICQLKQILDLACENIGKQVQRFQLRSLEILLSLLIGLDRFQADAGYSGKA